MEMKMGKCLKCGVNVEEGSAFCESCGAAIQSIEDSQRENAIRDGIQRNGKQNTMTWSNLPVDQFDRCQTDAICAIASLLFGLHADC